MKRRSRSRFSDRLEMEMGMEMPLGSLGLQTSSETWRSVWWASVGGGEDDLV